MIEFLRSFFGISDITGNRSVVGGVVNVDVRHVQYIKDSTVRLTALQHLYSRYKSTPHEAKIQAVFEKTKNIHAYLVSKKKWHELELFHLQNTDHFINTFTVILDVHQKHTAPAAASKPVEEESFFKEFRSATATIANKTRTITEAARQATSQRTVVQSARTDSEVAAVNLPNISIDTSSRIVYTVEGAAAGPVTRQIGFTASPEDKELFMSQVAHRLGIDRLDLAYVGNAMLSLPSVNGASQAGYVPILHWRNSTYALNLQDYRIYPVRMYRTNILPNR